MSYRIYIEMAESFLKLSVSLWSLEKECVFLEIIQRPLFNHETLNELLCDALDVNEEYHLSDTTSFFIKELRSRKIH